jgi:hypothetical protein
MVEHRREQIEEFEEMERGTNAVDVDTAMAARIKTLDNDVGSIRTGRNNHVLGHILYSPAINLGVSEHSFTED